MSIDAIIPVYKPDRRLYRCINMLMRQEKKIRHIYIMLTKSDELDAKALSSILKKRITGSSSDITIVEIEKSNFKHGGTRHKGACISDADYLLFMTQDAVPCDEYLTMNLYEAFENKDTAVAYARQIPYGNAGEVEAFSRSFNYSETSVRKSREDIERLGIKTFFCSNVCAMYSKRIYDELDGFDRKADFNEDMIFAYKAVINDYCIEYISNACVFHSHNLSLKEQFYRNRQIAISQRKNKEIFGMINSESEGIRYLKTGVRYFAGNKRYFALLDLIVESAVRYMGFFIGKRSRTE